ncbi:hypothetical protein ACT009_14940 [Sphingomonas sp. Tas61C01]|uniref:hypothetical protein n=1 Tax=Sphingomonas sp. Tas61C01 TaxID=3458297 RepID=UPI00403E5CEC
MTDLSDAAALRAAIVAALLMADDQNDTVIGALLASALDVVERRTAELPDG